LVAVQQFQLKRAKKKIGNPDNTRVIDYKPYNLKPFDMDRVWLKPENKIADPRFSLDRN